MKSTHHKDPLMLSHFTHSLRFLILSGFAVPLLRYTSLHFSAINNNAIRFLSGGIVLLIIALIRFRSQFPTILGTIGKNPKVLLLLGVSSCTMAINMVCFIKGLSLTSAFTGSVFTTFGIPLSTLLSCALYKDERERSLNKKFLMGMSICLIGSLLFVFQGSASQGTFISEGALYLIVSMIAQIFLSNIIKYLSKTIPVLLIGTINSLLTGTILLSITFFTGSIYDLNNSSTMQIGILIFAGMYGITVGMLLGFSIIKTQGVATFNILQLLIPIFSALFAYLLMGETIDSQQVLGASIILSGSYLCIFNKKV